jgi:hypothetical protein
MSDCPNLEKCGFVKKYGESKALSVKGFVTIYCKNEKQNECKRKEYKQKTVWLQQMRCYLMVDL